MVLKQVLHVRELTGIGQSLGQNSFVLMPQKVEVLEVAFKNELITLVNKLFYLVYSFCSRRKVYPRTVLLLVRSNKYNYKNMPSSKIFRKGQEIVTFTCHM